MTQGKKIAALELAAAIAGAKKEYFSPYRIANAVLEMQRIAASLHRRYENACCYEWATSLRYERRTEKLEAKAEEIGVSIGVKISFNRDPRGWPLIAKIDGFETRLA